jgi:hypothetical protein
MTARPATARPAPRWRNADEWQDNWKTRWDRTRGALGRRGDGGTRLLRDALTRDPH